MKITTFSGTQNFMLLAQQEELLNAFSAVNTVSKAAKNQSDYIRLKIVIQAA